MGFATNAGSGPNCGTDPAPFLKMRVLPLTSIGAETDPLSLDLE